MSLDVLADRFPALPRLLEAEDAAAALDPTHPRPWRTWAQSAAGEHAAKVLAGQGVVVPEPTFDPEKWRRIVRCPHRIRPAGCGCLKCGAKLDLSGQAMPITGQDCEACPVADGADPLAIPISRPA